MKIIKEKHDVVRDKWILQEFNSFNKYTISPYVSIFPQKDGQLWYNMLTGELILIDEKEIEKKEIFIKLVNNWYYINDNLNPKTVADILYEIVKEAFKNNSKTKKPKYVITSTFTCNARCYYCYENGLKQKPMTDEVAAAVGEFLIKKAKEQGGSISLSWFGGEPLCGSNAIRIISNLLKENNINFSSSMISNGYLFNEFPIKEIRREWNLTNCQITLDGTKENYQKIKNFKNEDENAYERVLNNIETLLENGVSVTIRLNVSKENGNDLLKLTEYLVNRYKEYKKILYIYTSPLFEGIEANYMEMNLEDSFLVHDYCKKIEDCARKHEMFPYRDKKFEYSTGHCMADSGIPMIITVDGNLTPCEHHFEEYICGNVWDGIIDPEPLEIFKEKNKNDPQCANCFYYPKCIRLKHCPTEFTCKKPQQDFLKYNLKIFVENEYNKYLNNNLSIED